MTVFVALLRAINVGGTGKLAMRDLTQLCESAGFRNVRTYIASGNVVFESDLTEAEVKAALEGRLLAHTGRAVGVVVPIGAEMKAAAITNPSPIANATIEESLRAVFEVLCCGRIMIAQTILLILHFSRSIG